MGVIVPKPVCVCPQLVKTRCVSLRHRIEFVLELVLAISIHNTDHDWASRLWESTVLFKFVFF